MTESGHKRDTSLCKHTRSLFYDRPRKINVVSVNGHPCCRRQAKKGPASPQENFADNPFLKKFQAASFKRSLNSVLWSVCLC